MSNHSFIDISGTSIKNELTQGDLFNPDGMMVYKRNELIHGQFDISAISQKILAAIISTINPTENELMNIQFTIPELALHIGVSRQRLHDAIDDITTELGSQMVRLKIRDSKDSFQKINWFRRSVYLKEQEIVIFIFNEDMKPYLIDFKGKFTKYSLSSLLSLRSKYTIRLYEIFRSFLSMELSTKNVTKVFRVLRYDELREMLCIDEKSLTRFYDFEKTVLSQAKKELDNADLSFNYSFPERKFNSKAKVTKINFCIYHRFNELMDGDWLSLLNRFTNKKIANSLLEKYSEDQVKRNVFYTKKQIDKGVEIQSLIAYVTTAVEKDYSNLKDTNESKESKRALISKKIMDISDVSW